VYDYSSTVTRHIWSDTC